MVKYSCYFTRLWSVGKHPFQTAYKFTLIFVLSKTQFWNYRVKEAKNV